MNKQIVVINPKTGEYFNAGDIADGIIRKYSNIRKHHDFEHITNMMFDQLYACDTTEQRSKVTKFMLDAFTSACYVDTAEMNPVITQHMKYHLAMLFIAAYDIYIVCGGML